MKKELGYRIRKLRESRDYTQENMAAELGITAGAYAKIERGETDASFTRLVHIAQILEVHLSNLLSGNPAIASALGESGNSEIYGFASKTELDTLSQLLKQINRRLEKLEIEVTVLKNSRFKQAK